jgi:dTDP-4-dehydrorhamnose reductase
MLGQDVTSAASAAGHDVLTFARADLDVTDAARVEAVVRDAGPDVAVNCAAWTDVDGAESSRAAAMEVNGPGAGHVARAAAGVGAWMIHISSDYVFDGHKRSPYVESDPTAPLSSYGVSKLAGEHDVAAAAPNAHTIVRSSWLFGAGGPCFPKTILRLAGERDELTVVDDQVGCPTFTGHLAEALVALAAPARRPVGVIHVAGSGHCSWYELARELVERADVSCDVKPGRTADLGRPAPRPAYSVLDTERGADAPRLPEWRAGVAAFLSAGVPS